MRWVIGSLQAFLQQSERFVLLDLSHFGSRTAIFTDPEPKTSPGWQSRRQEWRPGWGSAGFAIQVIQSMNLID